jgi:DNA end-binding protein Ku
MASSVWSGYLTFGLISMPVRLFSGARGNHISFHMLHRDDNTRIKQQLWCPLDERVVERSEIVKGYEYRKGEYVIIEPEEIKKIEPKTAKAMEILEFVKADDVDPIYFESSYFVTPEEAGPPSLCAAVQGAGRNQLRRHRQADHAQPRIHGVPASLQGRHDAAHHVLQGRGARPGNFGRPDVELKDAEVKVAHQLIEALAGEFEPEKYHDSFEENLKTLIKARLEGEEVTPVEKPKKMAPVVDLMAALKESLAQLPKKPPQRVEAAQRESEVKAIAKKAKGSRRKPAA